MAVKNTYDAAGRVVKQEMPDGGVTELLYDDENSRTHQKNQNGKIVIYESDGLLRNVRTIYGDGEETYEYNDRNQITLFTDKNGNKTRYSYDGRGNLTGITDALGRSREFIYNVKGQPEQAIQPDGSRILASYDGKGNIRKACYRKRPVQNTGRPWKQ